MCCRIAPLLLLVLPTSCDDGDGAAATAADSGADAADAGPADTGPDWPDLPEGGLASRVDDWVRAPTGSMDGRGPGDLLLTGEGGAFSLQGFSASRGWGPGFSVLDAWLRSGETEGRDLLQEWMPLVGTMLLFQRGMILRGIESLDAGGPDRDAVLVLEMGMAGIPLLDALAATPVDPFPLAVRLTVRFPPDGRDLEMTTEVENTGDAPFSTDLGDGVLWGDRVGLFAPRYGEAVGAELTRTSPFLAAWSPGELALVLVGDGQDYSILLRDEISILLAPNRRLEPGESMTYTRSLLLRPGDLDALLVELRQRTGDDTPHRPVRGRVTGDAAGAVVRADAEDARGAITRTVVGDDGSWLLHLPAGRMLLTVLAADGRTAGPVTVEVAAGDEPLEAPELALPRWGRLRVHTSEGAGGPSLPAKLHVHPHAGADPHARAARVAFSSGELVLPHPPGPVTVVASRGFEYGLATAETEVPEGGEAEVSLALEPLFPDRTWISADCHVHTEVSVDSGALVEDRVVNYAAEGVDLLVATDHDAASDLSALVEPAGLTGRLRTAVGIEISPLYGHMNAFPLQVPGLGADRWRSYWPVGWNLYEDGEFVRAFKPREVMDGARRDAGAKVLQINHPRSFQGIFEFARFLPTRGLVGDALDLLGGEFDMVEVINGKRVSSTEEVLPDWYMLLSQGYRVTASGNSDSHSAGQEAGYPRNLVPVSTQDLAALDLEEVWEGLLGQRSTVCGGPLVFVTAEGAADAVAGPGETVAATGGRVQLHVRVAAAEFVKPSRARIVVNGEEAELLEVPASTELERLDTWLELTPDEDAWVVVVVEGDGDLSPVVPGEPPLSLSNPIYLDVDGDGVWTAPGL